MIKTKRDSFLIEPSDGMDLLRKSSPKDEPYTMEHGNSTYLMRAYSILKRYRKENLTGHFEEGSYSELMDFGGWLINVLRPTLSPDSWRSYRYQLDQCIKHAEFSSLIDVPPSRHKKDIPKRTSAKRMRHLKPNDAQLLDQALSKSLSPRATLLRAVLKATIATGLRPVEWGTAIIHYHPKGEYLKAQSVMKGLRHSNLDRPYRYIPLTHLSKDELSAVHFVLTEAALIKAQENLSWPSVQKQLVRVLLNITRILFYEKNSPTLYSARHQFAANLKISDVPPEIIALVFGHASVDTQTHHYGRAVNGNVIAFDSDFALELNS